MKYLQRLFMSVLAILKKRKVRTYHSLAALLVVVALISLVTVLTTGGPAAKPTAAHEPAHASAAKNPAGTPAQSAVQLADQHSTASSATTPTTQAPAVPPATAQKTLKITPSTFTVTLGDTPGASNQAVSIQASNGKSINMPMFSDNNGGKFTFNFPGAPAKPSWDGQLMTYFKAPVGTYTLSVLAQDTTQAYYRGTITVTIVNPAPPPKPTMDITVQSLGYDAENDAVDYAIRINRQNGFDEPVINVVTTADADPNLGCYYQLVDDDTIAMACLPEGDTRPTSGTLGISVDTASITRFGNASYSFPPQP